MRQALIGLLLLLAMPALAGPPLPVDTVTFTNIVEGATTELTANLGAPQAKLARVVVTSTNCANCDVAITTTTGTGGTTLVYENTSMAASTVNGVVYSTYVNAINVGLVVPSSTLLVYVRVTNNDAEVTNDEDVVVRLEWEAL